jgi:glutamate dehydrogenase/leucine dehydrogenase
MRLVRLGATINTETINKLQCAIIAGSANNQLQDEDIHGPYAAGAKAYCLLLIM